MRFKFDGETDNPTDVSMYNIKESNQLVEEFMLLANITGIVEYSCSTLKWYF